MSRPDKILHAVGGTNPLGLYTVDADLVPSSDYHDTLKVSRCANGMVKAQRVVGGQEDCIDVNNHCENLVIEAALWEPRGQYLATIKGGSKNIALRGPVKGHGKTVDVDIGNLSDQSDDPTVDVKLDLVHLDGDPIRVRVLNGAKPIILNPETQRYDIVFQLPGFWARLWAKACALLKKIGLL